MKTGPATAEAVIDRQLDDIIATYMWTRVSGDRHTTLALIPLGLSRQGYERLAEYCANKLKGT